jgi:hypothetical protein
LGAVARLGVARARATKKELQSIVIVA